MSINCLPNILTETQEYCIFKLEESGKNFKVEYNALVAL